MFQTTNQLDIFKMEHLYIIHPLGDMKIGIRNPEEKHPKRVPLSLLKQMIKKAIALDLPSGKRTSSFISLAIKNITIFHLS